MARDMLAGADVCFPLYVFGDIWLRDTGPLLMQSPIAAAAAGFRFNG